MTTILLPVTIPIAGDIIILMAPLTAQDNVLLWPAVIVSGVAENPEIIGAPIPVKLTVTFADATPVAFVAVRV